MSELFSLGKPSQLLEGMRKARLAIGRGHAVVVPTDTAYAMVADAFKPHAVATLRSLRRAAENSPVGVFVPGIPTLRALAEDLPEHATTLAKEFWPGALTLIVPSRESLTWDLGDTQGTVALRMPQHPATLELLSETGPLASVQASLRGGKSYQRASRIADVVGGDGLAVVLQADNAVSPSKLSTVIDTTGLQKSGGKLRIVREGAIPAVDIFDVVGREFFV